VLSGFRVPLTVERGALIPNKWYQSFGVNKRSLHMVEAMKIWIYQFDGSNFSFWKMQIEDPLYQKDLYLPLEGVEQKLEKMSDEDWSVLNRKALGTIRLSLSPHVAFNIKNEKMTSSLMVALSQMYEKSSATNKVFLMKKLFCLKMQEGGNVAECLNNFNSITVQLEKVEIIFADEIRALLILSGLPESWEGMVVALSNSSPTGKLQFDEVAGILLSDELRRKNSKVEAATTGLVVTRGERSHGGSKAWKNKSPQCWKCGKMGHLRKDCKEDSEDSASFAESCMAL
jgi:hypothetical protein